MKTAIYYDEIEGIHIIQKDVDEDVLSKEGFSLVETKDLERLKMNKFSFPEGKKAVILDMGEAYQNDYLKKEYAKIQQLASSFGSALIALVNREFKGQARIPVAALLSAGIYEIEFEPDDSEREIVVTVKHKLKPEAQINESF